MRESRWHWRCLLRRRSVQWVMTNLKRRWAGLLMVVVTMLAGVAITLLKPWPLKILVDNVIGGAAMPAALASGLAALGLDQGTSLLLGALVVSTVVLFVGGWAVNLVHVIARIGYSQGLVYDLSVYLFGHLQRLSLGFHHEKPVGDMIRRVTNDTAFLRTVLQDALLPAGAAVFTLIGMITIMWAMNPFLSLVAVAVVPLMVVAFGVYASRMLERSYEQESAEGRIYSTVEQSLSAIPVVQAFAQEPRHERELRASTSAALQAAVASADVDVRFRIALGLATAVGTAAVLWFGAQQVMQGQLSLGGLLVFLSYQASFYGPLNTMMSASSTIQTAAGSARRVLEIMEADEGVREREHALPLRRVAGTVAFENVSFGYSEGRPVLRDISLVLEPGEAVALVGASGAGKSTLASLMLRLFDPWTGRVLLDGRDLRDVTLASLRDHTSVVLQEHFLFPLTIADNIAYGRPSAARSDIEAAARAANAHDFILSLPAGYDTIVGERGATISGGERQRIAIARALLKDAPILILDEPTSGLDATTEGLLVQALERLMRGRTTLIIAHRFTTLAHARRVAVLKAGRLVEFDSVEVLMARPHSAFRRLCELQGGRAASAPGAAGA